MENKNIRFVVAIILSLFFIDSYCRGSENMIESIDSAIIYMPIKDGVYTIHEFPGCTKDRLLDDIYTYNITQRICKYNSTPEILDSIKSCINNSGKIDTLSYNTYELVKYTPTDIPISKKLPGAYWTEQYQNLQALVVLYIKDEIELLWIGLDYAEYKNFRIKCDIFKLLDKSAI